MVALVLDGLVGLPAGLSPTFHLSPSSFHLSPSSFHLSPRLDACGRVPGWLVSHFLSFVSQFVSQATSFHLSPTAFHLSPTSCHCLCLPLPICPPLLFSCVPVLFICLSGWVLVVRFPATSSPLSAGDATFLFVCLPDLSLVVSALFRCFYSFGSHVCHC